MKKKKAWMEDEGTWLFDLAHGNLALETMRDLTGAPEDWIKT